MPLSVVALVYHLFLLDHLHREFPNNRDKLALLLLRPLHRPCTFSR